MKLTLIDNWRNCWKLASFQIAVLLIAIEGLQAVTQIMPGEIANYVSTTLLALIPLARLVKQNVKD